MDNLDTIKKIFDNPAAKKDFLGLNNIISVNATGEALKEPKHLTNKTMENKNEQTKQEKVSIEGFVASISDSKKFDSGKEVINVSIGSKTGEETTYKNVQVWNDSTKNANFNLGEIKKGDQVKITGYPGEYKEKEFISVTNVKDIEKLDKQQTTKVTESVVGNLTIDPKKQAVGENNVYSFSVGINKEGEETKFVNVNAWEKDNKNNVNKDLYELSTAKQGDLVEVKGYYKENEYKNKEGETKKDNVFIATSYNTISSQLSRKATIEEKNEYLNNAIKGGNFKEVDVALKAGADIKLAKDSDLSSLSEKQQSAIKDVISRNELFAEKKNTNNVKM